VITLIASKEPSNLMSPNYPNDYPNDVVYLWEISAPAEQLVVVYFLKGYVEWNYDYVTVS